MFAHANPLTVSLPPVAVPAEGNRGQLRASVAAAILDLVAAGSMTFTPAQIREVLATRGQPLGEASLNQELKKKVGYPASGLVRIRTGLYGRIEDHGVDPSPDQPLPGSCHEEILRAMRALADEGRPEVRVAEVWSEMQRAGIGFQYDSMQSTFVQTAKPGLASQVYVERVRHGVYKLLGH